MFGCNNSKTVNLVLKAVRWPLNQNSFYKIFWILEYPLMFWINADFHWKTFQDVLKKSLLAIICVSAFAGDKLSLTDNLQ